MRPGARRGAALAAGALAAVPFLGVLRGGFVNLDDAALILGNAHLRGLSAANLSWMWTSLEHTSYQPLGWLAYGLIAAAAGLEPAAFHAASLLLHAANAGLLCLLAQDLLAGEEDPAGLLPLAAALGTLVWAWHPLQAESVAWATEIPDLLATAFFLLAARAYARRPAGGGLGPCWVFFALSGLARWKSLSLPLVLVLLDLGPLRRLPLDCRRWTQARWRGVWTEKLPFVAAALVFLALNWKAKALGSEYRFAAVPEGAGLQLLFYARKFLVPTGLLPLYALSSPQALPWFGPRAAGALAACGLLLGLARRWPAPLLAAASFAAAVAPTLPFTLGGAWRPADHHFYLASLALAPLLAAGFLRLSRAGWLSPAAWGAALWLFALGDLSRAQTAVWRDSVSLWRHTLARDPGHPIARGELAVALYEENRPREAAAEFRRQLALHPEDARARAYLEILDRLVNLPDRDYSATLNDLGLSLLRQGRLEEAARRLEQAADASPGDTAVQMNLGRCLLLQGRPDKAEAHFRRAIAANPGHPEAHLEIALLLMQRGEFETAARHLRTTLDHWPRSAAARDLLGLCQLRLGRLEEALAEFRRALAAEPGHAGARAHLAEALKLRGRGP